MYSRNLASNSFTVPEHYSGTAFRRIEEKIYVPPVSVTNQKMAETDMTAQSSGVLHNPKSIPAPPSEPPMAISETAGKNLYRRNRGQDVEAEEKPPADEETTTSSDDLHNYNQYKFADTETNVNDEEDIPHFTLPSESAGKSNISTNSGEFNELEISNEEMKIQQSSVLNESTEVSSPVKDEENVPVSVLKSSHSGRVSRFENDDLLIAAIILMLLDGGRDNCSSDCPADGKDSPGNDELILILAMLLFMR